MSYTDKVCQEFRSFIQQRGWEIAETDEGAAKRLDIRYGKTTCNVKVYPNGTIQTQGAPSQLKDALDKLRSAIEKGEVLSKELLPFEIEAFPETLQKNIPTVDPLIVRFLKEAILSLKAGSLLGCSFLLGAASEKAIWLLIDSFTSAIDEEINQRKFRDGLNNKFVSKAYEDFIKRFKSCKSKPTDPALTHDLDTQVESIFQFFRICRNEVGHPHIPPNLDKGVLLANMGQFMKYMETIYRLIDYFSKAKITL
ncbi:MAG: hypothetical protein ACREQA_18910 [Candidatus Binatia bacterium]